MHIWSLAQWLLRLGHKVIIVTHAYGDRTGVRYMTNGLKVYYLPQLPFSAQNSWPSLLYLWPLFRDVMVRERIEIVHGHQATSSMMHDALRHARTMGLHTVYTDHSLFGFADIASISLNKLMRFTLTGADHCIAVSHTDRENLVLRAGLRPEDVSTIPNAVDASKFAPKPELRSPPAPAINVVVISRLAYRKGIDLVARVVPLACAKWPQMNFIIGGDGPKRLILEEMRERYQLHRRVELLGSVPHSDVCSVLCRGTVFLNCSLTESFCIAILEAASCGLFVVSTKVGGIPEVLPPDMVEYAAEPTAEALLAALALALPKAERIDPVDNHDRVLAMYSWRDVAKRTVLVYDRVRHAAVSSVAERITAYSKLGPFSGWLAAWLVVLDNFVWKALQWWRPDSEIEVAHDLPLPCAINCK